MLAVVYLASAALRPPGIFWSPDEGGKYVHVVSMAATHDPIAPLVYPDSYLDRSARFLPLFFGAHDGDRLYSWWPTTFPLMTLPLFLIFGQIGLYIIPAISGALCAGQAGVLVKQILPNRKWLPTLTASIVGLATPIAFYSATFWEHTFSTACVLGAIVATLEGWKTQRIKWFVAGGALASIGVFLRVEVVALAFGVGFALLLMNWRRALVWGSAFAITTAAWFLVNLGLMGNILGRQWADVPNSLSTGGLFTGLQGAGKWFIPRLLFNSPQVLAFEFSPSLFILGTACVAVTIVWPILPFTRFKWFVLTAYAILIMVCASVLINPQGYRSVHGLVLIAPQIVFAAWLYSKRDLVRKSLFPILLVAMSISMAVVYTVRAWDAAGGLQWGPRYLLTLYPLMVVASVVGLANVWPSLQPFTRRSVIILYVMSIVVGMGYEVRGEYSALVTMNYYKQSETAIKQLGSTPIVTHCIWLGAVAPGLYWSGSVFALHDSDQVNDWIPYARKSGIQAFNVVDLDLCELITIDQAAARRMVNPSGITVQSMQVGVP